MTRFVILPPDADHDEIVAAINELTARQARCVIPSTARELADDIDECLEALAALPCN